MTNPKRNLKTVQNTLSKMIREQTCPIAYQPRAGGGREFHCLAPTFTTPTNGSHDSQEAGKETWEKEASGHKNGSLPSRESRGMGREGTDEQQKANEARLSVLAERWRR
jgi:hypothetical protein